MLNNRLYLGEIVQKGQSFPGEHPAIVNQAQWAAVHALIAMDGTGAPPRYERPDREPMLLRGLLFTPDGERLIPSYSVKMGKTYLLHASQAPALGAWASRHGPLSAPQIVQSVVIGLSSSTRKCPNRTSYC